MKQEKGELVRPFFLIIDGDLLVVDGDFLILTLLEAYMFSFR